MKLNLIILTTCILIVGLLKNQVFANSTLEDDGIFSIRMEKQRNYGFHTGETLTISYRIITRSSISLDTGLLPQAGQINYWLELINNSIEKKEKNDLIYYKLAFTYQLFYAPLDVHTLAIPSLQLNFKTNGSTIVKTLPEWQFTMSPIKEVSQRGVGQSATSLSQFMQPSSIPELINIEGKKNNIVMLSIALLISSGLLVLIKYGIGKMRSPFDIAYRKIKQLKHDSDDSLVKSVKEIHIAFDLIYGSTLLQSDLDTFLNSNENYLQKETEIRNFFEESAKIFYKNENSMLDRKTLLKLCSEIAKLNKVM